MLTSGPMWLQWWPIRAQLEQETVTPCVGVRFQRGEGKLAG